MANRMPPDVPIKIIGTSVAWAGAWETLWFGFVTVMRVFRPQWSWGTNLFPATRDGITLTIGFVAIGLAVLGLFVKPAWFRIPAGVAACAGRGWQSWQVHGIYAVGVWAILVAVMFFAEWVWPQYVNWRDRRDRMTW